MRPRKRPPTRLALILLTVALLIAAISCDSSEAARPSAQPESTREPVTAPAADPTTQPTVPTATSVPVSAAEPTANPGATELRVPSNFTPEQIEAATQRANCLKDHGLDPEVVQSLARGEIPEFTPELIAASNACGMRQTIYSEPQTENPIQLDLTIEQTFCIYESLGADVVAELVAGGNPTVGAYDPFVAFADCGIDINEVLADR